MTDGPPVADENLLDHSFVHGSRRSDWARWALRRIPTDPRCKICYGPFKGAGGQLLKLTGFAPSRKNPRLCNS